MIPFHVQLFFFILKLRKHLKVGRMRKEVAFLFFPQDFYYVSLGFALFFF